MQLKVLKQNEIDALSETERKAYFLAMKDSLELEQKRLQRQAKIKAKQDEVADRKRLNHAKFLIAGELLASDQAVPFLKDLAGRTRFTKRHTDDLNLLMESLGFASVIKFIPMVDRKPD